MAVIDADAHVIETNRTWDYLDEDCQQFRPLRLMEVQATGEPREFWQIDGRLHPVRKGAVHLFGDGSLGDKVPTPEAARVLETAAARLAHMDEIGTDIQVLYPTLFINPFTDRPDIELALTRAYNRWLAAIWAQSSNRLRWAVALPLMSIPKAIEELHYGKEHGACAIFVRCVESGDRLLSDPYFYPLYEEASRAGLPICVHAANGSATLARMYANEAGFSGFKLLGVGAFHHLVFGGIPDRFPDLRLGFVELSAAWLPYVLNDLTRRSGRLGRPLKENVLRDNRIYVACQTSDDLPALLKLVGEDNLVMGTDYGHADSATEIHALQTLKQLETIPPSARRKILDDNARALYGI